MHKLLVKFDPVVPKSWLLVAAGIMWLGVSLLLVDYAYTWLLGVPRSAEIISGTLGLVGGLAAYRYGFSHLALKNSRRIRELSEKVCFFAFQNWKGYLVIVFMMALGITLRHSSIPREYLIVIYATVGLGLFLSSFHYFYNFYQTTFSEVQP
jgi:hypothetical protein